ncbi:hypothetical protein ODJ79_41475 [Actinoplanes sp. KI2]|uniref:hypothetical protein n=1 Tax=Actinoplanes sp. KI2 TaxID=2983315 RepID=UPI0021D59941|nr:hypothetical protein [Actinoplanes sp. KI2]MCU7730227.1 hypothetical protein [Actinoplanes sp. KI2]
MAETDPLVVTWRQIIVGDEKSWVLFKHGTCVILVEPGDDLAEQAVAVLREFGPVQPGSPSADFGTITLESAPGWVVTGHHSDVLTYVAPSEISQEDDNLNLAVGLTGRSKRDQDARDLTITHIEDKRTS